VSQVRKISSSSGTYLCLMQGSACERWTLGGCSLLGIGLLGMCYILCMCVCVGASDTTTASDDPFT
jgi:hypothetical protein